MDRFYTANILLTVGAMTIMSAGLKFNVVLDRRRRRITACLFGAINLAALCEWLGNALNGAAPSLIPLHIAVKTIELSITPFIGVFCGRSLNDDNQYLDRYSIHFAVANLVLEVVSAFTGLIFTVDEANVYHHTRFYGIYVFFCVCCVLGFLLRGLQTFHRYQSSGGELIVLVTIFLVCGIAVQVLYEGMNVTWLTVGISAIMLYKFYGDITQQVDGLTELINRWGYENYLSHFSGKGAILYFDVDRFKQVNDSYGHIYGDSCLRRIADCIRTSYASSGRCFRTGGDEFCVILDKNLDQLSALTDNFIGQIRAKREEDSRLPQVSIGYTLFDTEKGNINDAVKKADAEMYLAKQNAHANEKSQGGAPAPEKL